MMVNMMDWVVLCLDESMGTPVLQETEELAEMQQPIALMRGHTAIFMSEVLRWQPQELPEAKGPPKQRAK